MNRNSFCVIGLGKFGQSLALSLMRGGNQVTVIDYDSNTVNSIADQVTEALIGDPTNETFLKASGVADCDCAVICTSAAMNDSILITIILKELGVKRIVARAISERHKMVLEKVGADIIVYPEKDMGEKLATLLSHKRLRDYFEFSDQYSIAEIVVPEKWVGKSIAQNDIRKKYNVTIIAIRHQEGKVEITPDPSIVFAEGDSVSIVGDANTVEKLTT